MFLEENALRGKRAQSQATQGKMGDGHWRDSLEVGGENGALQICVPWKRARTFVPRDPASGNSKEMDFRTAEL